METQEKYVKDKIIINTEIIDNIEVFSDKEKSEILLKILYKGEILEKYLKILENEKSFYHFFIACKIAYLFRSVGLSKEIYSFLAFLNSFPIELKQSKSNQFINLDILNEMINDISESYDLKNRPELYVVTSSTFEESFVKINKDLKEGKKVFVLSTYKTIGNGKNIQYEIPNIDSILTNIVKDENDERNEKDFDAIYLSTPTNLIQNLRYDSDSKIKDLCNYLFQQEYLYFNNYLTYGQRKINIENGFRRVFYGDNSCLSYKRNPDILLNTAQLIIQAVGRICRCRNKNKMINIFTDKEVVERLKLISSQLENGIYNKEFKALLETDFNEKEINLEKYSIINKTAFVELTNKAKKVRDSESNVKEWQELRDYVLKNPTAPFIIDKYKKYYFYFDDPYSGYSFKFGKNYCFKSIKLNNTYENEQVSEEDSDLTKLMNIKEIKDLFTEKGYSTNFKKNNYIMSQSLYKQIYKGALGEVVGKYLIDKGLGYEIEELDDYSMYEVFDFKIGNIYFDFKHWDEFIVDNDAYCKKVKWKLNSIQGTKVVVANIFQRGNHKIKESVDNTIIQVPYIINDNNEIDYSMLDNVDEIVSSIKNR